MMKTMRIGRSGIRFIALAALHGFIAFLAQTSLAVILAQPRQGVTQSPDTSDRIQELRFPVAHHHAMSVCLGYLSITPERITYQVPQTDRDRNHSFDVPRSEVKMARPWTVLNEPMNAAEIKFGNVTYHFWLVAAEDVEGGYMSRPPDAQDPIAIIESIHDFNFVAETVGARLEVSARVAGVHVSVNGRPQGITDASGSLIVKGLKAGDYDVQLSVNGYTDFHRRVTLNYGKTERITAVLESAFTQSRSTHEEFVTRQENASVSNARPSMSSTISRDSGGSLPPKPLEGLFFALVKTSAALGRIETVAYDFFPGGHVYGGAPQGGLLNVSFSTLERQDPAHCGTYEIVGTEIRFHWADGSRNGLYFERLSPTSVVIGQNQLDMVMPADGLRLRGVYERYSRQPFVNLGSKDVGGVTTTHSIRFSTDGRFERNDNIAVNHREELPGGTIGLTTGHHDSNDAGTYEIAGNTIQLNYANGVRDLLTFFAEPSEHGQQPPGMIWLDGRPFLLK